MGEACSTNEEVRNTHIFVGKSERKSSLESSRLRWEDIKMDPK
jgi:hypothetical protein